MTSMDKILLLLPVEHPYYFSELLQFLFVLLMRLFLASERVYLLGKLHPMLVLVVLLLLRPLGGGLEVVDRCFL